MDADHIVAFVVAELLRVREEKGLSIRDLAEKTGLSRAGIGHMENGKTSPTLRFLLIVAEVLEVELTSIIQDGLEKEKPTD